MGSRHLNNHSRVLLTGTRTKAIPRVEECGDKRLQRVPGVQEALRQPERVRAVPQRGHRALLLHLQI